MKNEIKKDTGLLAFTALYSIIMIFILVATVFILSNKKQRSTEITKYVVETEYVYIVEQDRSEQAESDEKSESESLAVLESTFETLWVKEYSGKIGIFNADGEAVHIIDAYSKRALR